MADALASISTRRTPQREQADPRQVKNNAGGYVYQAQDEAIIHRFLTMGVEGGTFYVGEQKLAQENAKTVLAAARDQGSWLVERVLEVSLAGRAPRQDPAIFALAAVAGLGDDEARAYAMNAVPKVCRIGTTLFTFLTYVQNFRGWGRGLRKGVGAWYTEKDLDALAYQVVKYRSRNGWTHGDVLRRAHPQKEGYDDLFKWVLGREVDSTALPGIVQAHIQVMNSTDPKVWLKAIEEQPMSWEMFPDVALADGRVWAALIEKGMPPTALMRNLPRFTNLEILKGSTLKQVTDALTDEAKLRKGRIHPVSVLLAMKTYSAGHSFRGKSTWAPVRQVVDALDAAFYLAFGSVEPSGKRKLLALDVSGSMGAPILDSNLSCREASAALALVEMSVDPDCTVVGFTNNPGRQTWSSYRQNVALTELAISPRQRLDDAVRTISGLPFGGTDCSLPMTWAQQQGREFDTIEVFTDNETWHGDIHPMQALRSYREHSGINTSLAVVALTPTHFSIADPRDRGTLDVSGFDSQVPNLLSDFSRGLI